MSDVKRYDPLDDPNYMTDHPDGDYVRYEDYERLERENADLRKQLEQAQLARDNWHQIVKDQNDAEIEARKCASKYDQSDSFGVESLATIIERIIGQLEQAEARLKWISVSESLPEFVGRDDSHVPGGAPATLFSDEVIVFDGRVRMDHLVQAEGMPETRTYYVGTQKPVTHWMRKPNPPTEQKEPT